MAAIRALPCTAKRTNKPIGPRELASGERHRVSVRAQRAQLASDCAPEAPSGELSAIRALREVGHLHLSRVFVDDLSRGVANGDLQVQRAGAAVNDEAMCVERRLDTSACRQGRSRQRRSCPAESAAARCGARRSMRSVRR